MKRNLVSVIIPAKNRVSFTEEALKSVVMQRLPHGFSIEIIIVDNRSNPPLSKQLSKKYPEVIFTKNTGKDHPGATRNVGLKMSKGEYIAFLDNDDQWMEDFLASSITNLKEKKSAATVCFTDAYFYGRFPILRKLKLIILNTIRYIFLYTFCILNKKILPPQAFYLCQISHMVFKREFIKNTRFDEEDVVAEDWQFIINTTFDGSIVVVPKFLVKFRYEIKSNTNSILVKKLKKSVYENLLNKLPESYGSGFLNLLFKFYVDYFLVK